MGLDIYFGTVQRACDIPSWLVRADHILIDGLRPVLLWGFARQTDALIAKRTMETTVIDWTAPERELRRQWEAFGGRPAMMKHVCEQLQW